MHGRAARVSERCCHIRHRTATAPDLATGGQCYRKGARGPRQRQSGRKGSGAIGQHGQGQKRPSASNRALLWRRRASIAAVAALLLWGGLWTFHRGPTPQRWLHSLTASLSEQLGVPVSIRTVTVAGIDRIALHDVRIAGDVPLETRRVVAAFSLGEFVRNPGQPAAALRWVRVDDWRVRWSVDELPGTEWLAALGGELGLSTDTAGSNEAGDDTMPRGGMHAAPAVKSAGERLHETLAAFLAPLIDVEWADGNLDVYVGQGHLDVVPTAPRSLAGEVGSADALLPPLSVTGEGTLVLGQGRLALRHGDFAVEHRPEVGERGGGPSLDGLRALVNGTLWPRPDLYVHAEMDPSGWTGDGSDGRTAVPPFRTAEAEAWLAGSWQRLDAWGTVRLRDAALPWWSEPEPYTVDEAVVQWGRRPDGPLQVNVEASRDGARLRMDGVIAAGGGLDFVVAATDVAVPGDVPPLEGQDVRGNVDFSGVLGGTWEDPVLEGEAQADGGYLFGQPVSELQGNMRLSASEFGFHSVRASQGNSHYFLEGTLAFAEGMPFELLLRTDRGRAETLLAVLNWDIPVHARLKGAMRFARTDGVVEASGQAALERGSAWGQPFDRAEGDFRYADGQFVVSDAVGFLRGGQVTGSGGSDPGGWRVHVEAEDVPLQALLPWREALPGATGVFDFVGEVTYGEGDESPGLRGEVAARHVHIGLLDFAEGQGVIALDGRELLVEGIRLRRDTGGVYDVVGKVADVFEQPRLALDVDVRGESVEALVAVTDWRLPLLARSEPLRARIDLTGPSAAPEAAIRVEADAVYVLGRPAPLALDLRWRDGRIEVERDESEQGIGNQAGT